MQVLVLQGVGPQDGLDLGGGGGLAPQGQHPQGGGNHHGGHQDVVPGALVQGHVVVETTQTKKEAKT